MHFVRAGADDAAGKGIIECEGVLAFLLRPCWRDKAEYAEKEQKKACHAEYPHDYLRNTLM